MHNLRPAILDQGLVAAVQWMAAGFERRTGIQCAVHAREEQMQLPPGVPLVAYRAAQEALTNVAKHAQASRVDIELSMQAGVLTLEVNDNGRGIAPEDLAKARSFGIRGLHERAATVGGWVDLSSNSTGNGGTSVILSVPLDDDALEGGSGWGEA
jgi:signal transduction histidine kinase